MTHRLFLYSAPSEIVNLGRVKAPIIGDRKRVRIALIRARLRRVQSSIPGSFHAGQNSQFLTGRSISRLCTFFRVLFCVAFLAENLCSAQETTVSPKQNYLAMNTIGDPNIVIRTKQIILPECPNAFNPSIIALDNKEGFLLIFRYSPSSSKHWISYIGVVYLDNDFEPVLKPRLLSLRHVQSKTPSQSEDARIFSFRGRYFLIFNDNVEIENPLTTQRRDLYLTELFGSEDRFSLSSPIKLTYEQKYNAQWWQKNWVPFIRNDDFFLIYSIDPHEILYPSLLNGNCYHLYETKNEINWDWGHLRGGTPAMLVDGEYLTFFHSSIKISSDVSQGKELWHYFMGAYTFSPEPPFTITKISPAPLAKEGFYTSSDCEKRVIFPGGFVVVEPFIYVAYGKDDCEMWIATLDKTALLQSLQPLGS